METFIIVSHPAVSKKRTVIAFSPLFSLSSFSFLVLALTAKHHSWVLTKSRSSRNNWYPMGDTIVVMCKVNHNQLLIKQYLSSVPPTGHWTSMAQDFFKVDPGAAPEPTCAWRLQKCLRPFRHSPKEGGFRRQAINLTHPRRIKT